MQRWPGIILLSLLLSLLACHHQAIPGPQPVAPGHYTADLQTDLGLIEVELYPNQAPLAVGNFVGLAQGTQPWRDPLTGNVVRRPLYDGLTFHRVIPGFMIQGGDPQGTGEGNPGYQFRNEVHPGLLYDRPGRLAMANAGPDTNGCQFFITTTAQPHLDGKYTIFGQVIGGQDVVQAISKVPRDAQDKPLTPVHLRAVVIHRS
ncbi:MAG: peptidylprolyl isomerase [Terriglobales bacterium]